MKVIDSVIKMKPNMDYLGKRPRQAYLFSLFSQRQCHVCFPRNITLSLRQVHSAVCGGVLELVRL